MDTTITVYNKLLELPEVPEQVAPTEKRFVQNPDVTTLTEEQKQVFDAMVEFLSSSSNYFLLEGYAGTGKTYLISMFVEYILYSKNKKIAMTAPTNKAVKVLRTSGNYQDPNLNYSTIHSLLGLKEKIDGYGNQTFIQLRSDDSKAGEYDIIIVDEVSMLSDDLLVGTSNITGLFEYSKMFNIKLIFVGDPCQIPPIGKENCLPFREADRNAYGIQRRTLENIVRQSKDNPIINITLEVRKALGRDIVLPVMEDNFMDNLSGVYFLGIDQKEFFNNVLRAYFTSENFKQNSDFVKIVAYTNKIVNAFNKKVRTMIYGKDAPKICIGEKLIANRPIVSEMDNTILFTNNDEFEVESYEVVEGNYKGAEITYYDAVVIESSSFAGRNVKKIKIIHEKSEEDYQLILNYLKDLALQERKGSWEAAKKWEEFYAIQEVFADVNYNYAITAHKSQGSTYTNVIVLDEDININRKVRERNRIKYTAYTRPSERLFIVI